MPLVHTRAFMGSNPPAAAGGCGKCVSNFRQECLDAHRFMTPSEAREVLEAWRREYNESCLHRALEAYTPNEFANVIAAARELMRSRIAENSP